MVIIYLDEWIWFTSRANRLSHIFCQILLTSSRKLNFNLVFSVKRQTFCLVTTWVRVSKKYNWCNLHNILRETNKLVGINPKHLSNSYMNVRFSCSTLPSKSRILGRSGNIREHSKESQKNKLLFFLISDFKTVIIFGKYLGW